MLYARYAKIVEILCALCIQWISSCFCFFISCARLWIAQHHHRHRHCQHQQHLNTGSQTSVILCNILRCLPKMGRKTKTHYRAIIKYLNKISYFAKANAARALHALQCRAEWCSVVQCSAVQHSICQTFFNTILAQIRKMRKKNNYVKNACIPRHYINTASYSFCVHFVTAVTFLCFSLLSIYTFLPCKKVISDKWMWKCCIFSLN